MTIRYILVLIATAMFCLGCNKSDSTFALNKTDVIYKHGSKITTIYDTQKNQVNFFQDDIKIKPALIINSKNISESHSFEFNESAFYEAHQPPPKVVTFTLLHDTPKKSGWKFSPKARLVIAADGRRFESPICQTDIPLDNKKHPPQCYQSELKKDDPKDAEFYETLIMDIPFEFFSAMGSAHSVQMQIGNASFNMPEETLAAFKSFTDLASK